jgi:hypothetical protein
VAAREACSPVYSNLNSDRGTQSVASGYLEMNQLLEKREVSHKSFWEGFSRAAQSLKSDGFRALGFPAVYSWVWKSSEFLANHAEYQIISFVIKWT